MTNRKMRVMYIVVAGLFLVICIFLFGGGYMNKNNHTQEIPVDVKPIYPGRFKLENESYAVRPAPFRAR